MNFFFSPVKICVSSKIASKKKSTLHSFWFVPFLRLKKTKIFFSLPPPQTIKQYKKRNIWKNSIKYTYMYIFYKIHWKLVNIKIYWYKSRENDTFSSAESYTKLVSLFSVTHISSVPFFSVGSKNLKTQITLKSPDPITPTN